MKNAIIVLCLVLLAACISFGGWILSRPNPRNQEIAKLETELKQARGEIARLESALEKQKEDALAQAKKLELAAAAAPAKAQSSSEPTASQPAKGKSAGKSTGAQAFRQMMQAPGMKEVIKQQNLAQLDMLYGRLFDTFQLNAEEKENFKQLLAARTSAQMEMGLKLIDENLTPEQKKQITADYEAAKKASDEAIHTFLGDEADYKTFQHWEDTQPERAALEMMGGRAHFATAGEPLTSQQEQQLVDVMAAVRKAPSDVPDLSKPENVWGSGGTLTDEMVQKQLEKYDRDAQTVAQNAAGFLSATQLQALEKMQAQMRTMAEAGLKMAKTMMGGK